MDYHLVTRFSGLGKSAEEKSTDVIKWSVWKEWKEEERTNYRVLETYHNGVLGEALPHILYKLNKVFRVAICHIQAYIFHLGNSFQDLLQLFKV